MTGGDVFEFKLLVLLLLCAGFWTKCAVRLGGFGDFLVL
jgi:hypothetical protein